MFNTIMENKKLNEQLNKMKSLMIEQEVQEDMLDDIGSISTIVGGTYVSTNRNRVIQMYGNYRVFIPLFRPSLYNGSTFNYIYDGNFNSIINSLTGYGIYHHEVTDGLFNWALPTANQYFEYDCDGDPINNMPNNRVYFNNVCTKNNPVMVTFLNSLGGYESFLFSGVNRKQTSIERLLLYKYS